jgi:hypothetical protein
MTSLSVLVPRRDHDVRPRRGTGVVPGRIRWLEPAVLLGAGVAGVAAVQQPVLALGACVPAGLVALVWVRPATAAYLLVGVTPLVAGIDRGVVIPLFRPNEALGLLVGATLAVRWLVRLRSGEVRVGRPDAVEVGLLLFAVTSSVTPLATMALRGQEISSDDILYSLVLWKLAGLYWIVRASVRDVRAVLTCLLVSLVSAFLVAVIGILQGLDMLGVRGILAAYYAQNGDTSLITDVARGGSTLSLPVATADLMIMNLAVLATLWLQTRRYTALCCTAAAVMLLATLAAGEFSSLIGLVVGMVLLAWVTRAWSLLGVFALASAGGAAAVWPVLSERLSGFALSSGIPVSWLGRLHNLQTYFWPDLFTTGNVILGVRPSARVPKATEALGWAWIESGYTWLLWGGGVPLFLSFLYFAVVAPARGWLVARGRGDAAAAAGAATFVGFVVIAVLMLFDPHITYRGSGDEAFALLALAAVGRGRGPDRPSRPDPRELAEDQAGPGTSEEIARRGT